MQLSDLDVRPLQLHILALMVAARYVAAQMVQTRRDRAGGLGASFHLVDIALIHYSP
jgi:hypothetical protein